MAKYNSRFRGKRCNKEDYLECPVCGRISTADEWDARTYSLCRSREERKDFRSITLNISRRDYSNELRYYYYCDHCKALISGDKFGRVIKSGGIKGTDGGNENESIE